MPIHIHAPFGWLTVLLALGACGDKGGGGPSSGDTGPKGGGIDTGIPDDVDGDGFSEDDGDCDDDDAAVHPGAEDCGVVDANCDGVIDDAGTWVPRDYEAIQDAIDAAADGASICVEAGTYEEILDTLGKALWIVGVDGAASTVLDGAGNSPVLSIVRGEGRDTVVEGLTITGGQASTGEDYTSGGVVVVGASPTLRGLVVTGNQAWDHYTSYYGSSAGGMVLVDSNARVDEVEISDNSTSTTYGTANGGGLYVLRGSAEFTSLRIHGNYAYSYEGYAYGGGAELSEWTGTFRDGEIYDNVAEGYFSAEGGGLLLDSCSGTLSGITVYQNAAEGSAGGTYGGGLAIIDGTDALSDLDVHDNMTSSVQTAGGGLYASGGRPSIGGALIWRNSVAGRTACGGGLAANAIDLTNVLVFANEVWGSRRGGICAYGEGMSLLNVTLYANVVNFGGDAVGGGLWVYSSAPSLVNVDLSGNQADDGSAVYDESATLTASSFSYCNIYDQDVVVAGTPLTVAGSGGNLSVDPLYADVSSSDAADWDLSLGTGSPLIDAGDPSISDADGTRSDIGGYGGPGGSWR